MATADELLREADDGQVWIKAVYLDVTNADDWWSQTDFIGDTPGQPPYRPGDLVLIYATGAKRCNAVVEVSERSRFDPDALRRVFRRGCCALAVGHADHAAYRRPIC